jgi:methyltransferase
VSASVVLYLLLLVLTALERLAELRLSRRHAAWSFSRGGVEHGAGHYPAMVLLHTGLLLGCAAEVLLLDRPFTPAIGGPMLVVAALAQGLRWWCIRTLGPRWNTRVIVVPGLAPVQGGPYRSLRHPNYLAVIAEGVALPLIHGAWWTALVFSLLNALLLRVRVRVEDRALASLPRSGP